MPQALALQRRDQPPTKGTLMHRTRRLAAPIAGALLITVMVLGLTGTASAHVDAEATQAADGLSTVDFSFQHGCGEAPTTSLRIQLPEGTSDVQAENPSGWTSAVNGNELQWTGGSVPGGQTATFTASMRIVGTAGETIFLPTLQGCPDGAEEAWIDKSDDPEAENAAPRIVLTEAVTALTTTSTTTTAPPTTSTTTELAAEQSSDSSSTHVGMIILIVAIVVLVIAAAVVALRFVGNRTKSSS